jgi:hypothetical protein
MNSSRTQRNSRQRRQCAYHRCGPPIATHWNRDSRTTLPPKSAFLLLAGQESTQDVGCLWNKKSPRQIPILTHFQLLEPFTDFASPSIRCSLLKFFGRKSGRSGCAPPRIRSLQQIGRPNLHLFGGCVITDVSCLGRVWYPGS